MIKDHSKRYNDLMVWMNRLGTKIPDTMESFFKLRDVGLGEGALPSKTKELIALAIGITVRCDGCIAYHVHDALAAGASAEEIQETIGVAILMGGGPSVVYGCEALEALEQFVVLESN